MAISGEWIDYPQMNQNIEDDKITAYIFGRPVKFFEDDDGEIRKEFRFKKESEIRMVSIQKVDNLSYVVEIGFIKAILKNCFK